MHGEIAIIDANVDQITAEGIAHRDAIREAEGSAAEFEQRATGAREAAQMRRLEFGRFLIRVRAAWPARGPKAKGWSEYLKRIEVDDSTAWRYMDLAGFRRSPEPDGVGTGTTADFSHDERNLGEERPGATQLDDGGAPLLTTEVVIDRDTWCTPRWLTEALGEVDLDPCANERSHVQARNAFRLEERGENGLALANTIGHDWRVFVNPPYSNVRPWIAAYRHTRFCFLLKLDPSTKWFVELYEATALILIPKGTRIEFEAPPNVPKDKAGANQFPHALFYARVDDAPAALREQCFTWITNHERTTDR